MFVERFSTDILGYLWQTSFRKTLRPNEPNQFLSPRSGFLRC